jgi:APA family basic amino acid/polyamine antiporter
VPATLATAFGGDYLSEFVTLPKLLVGAVFIGVLALVNFRGIKESVTLNLGLTSIELTGLLLVTVIGFAFLLDGGGDPARRWSSSPARSCRWRSCRARRWRSSR